MEQRRKIRTGYGAEVVDMRSDSKILAGKLKG
jgi:hypothetical protein